MAGLCNISAGIAIIGFQSPLFQALWHEVDATLDVKTLATYGATLIAVTSLFNGVGRFLWGWLSDKLGCSRTFTIMLGSEILVFAVLAYTMNPWLFAGLFCYILPATAAASARCPPSSSMCSAHA